MNQYLSVVTRKGQVTIPAEIREKLGIERGDKVAFELDEDGVLHITLTPIKSVADMVYGALKPLEHAKTVHELEREYAEGVAEQAMANLDDTESPQ